MTVLAFAAFQTNEVLVSQLRLWMGVVFIIFVAFIIISLQIFTILDFCSSVFTPKSYRIGLRMKRLSKHPCPEATLPGMNNKWIVFQSKWISWPEGYISPIKLYKNLGYLESVIIGWIDLWNYRWCWTLWEDQNVWDPVLEKIYFVCVLCAFSMTLGWLYDFLKPQFLWGLCNLFKNAMCSKNLYWYLWILIHKKSSLDRGGYLKKYNSIEDSEEILAVSFYKCFLFLFYVSQG